MAFAFQGTDLATASKFLKGATEVTLRQRLLPRFLDEEGRINRNADGKDLNWLLEYKLPVASSYTPGQQLTFNNDNFNIPASVTPEWMIATSGMNYTDIQMNSGTVSIVDNYLRRGALMTQAMQVKFAKDLYSYAPTNPKSITGLSTLFARSTSLVCTNADRLAVPLAGVTYAGLQLAPGSYGGSWSSNLPTALQMSTVLGSDWPDGQGSPDQLYDGTTPRMYNENTNQWLNPGATPANGTWQTNCISMISRANTDLSMNSTKTMMPTVIILGAQRMQAVKDTLRTSFRDVQTSNKAAENLGYYDAYNFEGAAIDLDHECPADRTFAVCAASMDLFFYGSPAEGGGRLAAAVGGDTQSVTGGIYTVFGPERVAGSLEWCWIMIAGGNVRYNPKWTVCMKDFTTGV